MKMIFSLYIWLPAVMLAAAAGCCTGGAEPKPPPVAGHVRGWIGGVYEEVGRPGKLHGMAWAGQLPKPLVGYYRRGVLLTAVGSNAPVRLAGLREGDIIVQLNHQPLSNSAAFFQTIDSTQPGTVLPVTAWRDGQAVECNVSVGRETWKPGGNVTLPLLRLGPLDLIHNHPGFSVIALGYEPVIGRRVELDDPQGRYLAKNDLGAYQPNELEWDAWLVVISVQKWKTIVSQETVSALSQAQDGSHPK